MPTSKFIFIMLGCAYSMSLSVWAKSYCYIDPHGIKRISTIKIDKQYTECSSLFILPIDLQQKLKEKINSYSAEIKNPPNTNSASNKKDHHSEIMCLIRNISHRYNIDPNLVKAIIAVESGYNPNAVSSRGAVGLMQLMPATAKELAENAKLDIGEKRFFDPKINISLGVRYLAELADRYNNNFELMLAAYHAGIGSVARYNNKVPPYSATQRYIRDVTCRYKEKYASYDKSIFCKL